MNSANEDLRVIIHAYLDGSATEEQWRALNDRLRQDPLARELYLRMADLHGTLAVEESVWGIGGPVVSLGNVSPNGAVHNRFVSWLARPLIALAAALAFGFTCASIGWAVGLPKATKTVTMLIQSFLNQTGPVPSHFPDAFDIWSGDQSEVISRPSTLGEGVLEKEDVLLRFMKAEADLSNPEVLPKSCDVARMIDLRSVRKELGDPTELQIVASATFLDATKETLGTNKFAIRLFSFSGNGRSFRERWPNVQGSALSLGTANFVVTPESVQKSKRVTAKMIVPADADIVVVQLVVVSMDRASAVPVQFGGHYCGDIRMTASAVPTAKHSED